MAYTIPTIFMLDEEKYITHIDRHAAAAYLLSCVLLYVTPWTTACQTPLSMEFSRQEYWSGLPRPPHRQTHI